VNGENAIDYVRLANRKGTRPAPILNGAVVENSAIPAWLQQKKNLASIAPVGTLQQVFGSPSPLTLVFSLHYITLL